MSELTKCPFCGSSNLDLNFQTQAGVDVSSEFWIECNQCRSTGPRVLISSIYKDGQAKEAGKMAIDKWNERR